MSRDEAERAILAAIPLGRARHAIASIVDSSLPAGESLLLDRHPFVVPRPVWLGFIDLYPGRNWGHPCLYVLCNLADAGLETQAAEFPPALGTRRLVTLSVGSDVPHWARPQR